MPLRDAVRTSILSRKWRYYWQTIPKLAFPGQLFKALCGEDEWSLSAISIFYPTYQVLLLHHGPLLEFSLCTDIQNASEIDQIIFHLSRNNTLQKLTLHLGDVDGVYTMLPSSFFSFSRLMHLSLTNIKFRSPLTIGGFRMLTSLYMEDFSIPAKTLLHLLSNCILLKSLSLILMDALHMDRFNVVELFECLPAIEQLHLSFNCLGWFCRDRVLQKPPKLLVYLTSVTLAHWAPHELWFVLLVIRSSPNLKKLKIETFDTYKIEAGDLSDVWLECLVDFEMEGFADFDNQSEFLKMILLKSPMLKTVRILLRPGIESHEELKVLRGLLLLPRLSPVVEIIVRNCFNK